MTVEEKRPKRRFLWVDWLILAAALAVLVGGILWVRARKRAESATVPIAYTLMISGEAAIFGEGDGGWERLIPVGAAVSSSNGAIPLGRVSDLRVRPHERAVVKGGKIVWEKDTERVDLYVTVRADALTGDGLRVSDVRIAANDTGDYYLGGFYAHGARVVSVKREVAE